MVDDHTTETLRGEQFHDAALERIREQLRSGSSPELLARAAVGAPPSYEAVVKIMRTLENMALVDVDLSLKIMVGLYPVASELFAHDVSDAIELWIEHEGTRDVREFILALLVSSSPFAARDKLAVWAELLAAR